MTTETNGEPAATPTASPAPAPDMAPATTPSLTDPSPAPAATPAATPAADPLATPTPTPAPAADPAAEPKAEPKEGETPPVGKAWEGQELDDDLKKFVGDKTPAQVAKELMNAQALLGKKAIGIPGKDSTPEEQRAFHKARGVPEDEKGYDLAPALTDLKATAPEGWEASPEMEESFRKAARLANLSNGEANEFAKHYLGEQFKAREAFVNAELTATKDAKALLTETWGPDPKPQEENFARGMRAIGLEAGSIDVFLSAFGSDGKARFGMANAVAEIGRRQMEGGPPIGLDNQPGSTTMTKEGARTEMERIKADPVLGAAYTDINHPQHKAVSANMTRLGKIERGI